MLIVVKLCNTSSRYRQLDLTHGARERAYHATVRHHVLVKARETDGVQARQQFWLLKGAATYRALVHDKVKQSDLIPYC